MTETPDFDLESGEDCAKMYRLLRDRAEDMGFPTVTALMDHLEMLDAKNAPVIA